MKGIFLDSVVYIMATFRTNKDRIKSDPPKLPFEPSTPELRAMFEQNMTIAAQNQDYYQDLVQLSWMQNTDYVHIFVVPDQPERRDTLTSPGATPGMQHCWYVPNKQRAAQIFWETINQLAGYPESCTIGGWQLRNDVWPKLVNLGMASGQTVNSLFKADIAERFGGTRVLMDVAEIYLQGAHPIVRRAPELPDFLKYLGYVPVAQQAGFPLENSVARMDEKTWREVGHLQVCNLLHGMQTVVRYYYGAA